MARRSNTMRSRARVRARLSSKGINADNPMTALRNNGSLAMVNP